MTSQAQLKKQFGYGKKVKSCASCKYMMGPNLNGDMICKKTSIVVENEITGIGNETVSYVCKEWSK